MPQYGKLTIVPRLIKEDRRLRIWHIPMGPLLWKDNYSLYFPGDPDNDVVPNYYESDMKLDDSDGSIAGVHDEPKQMEQQATMADPTKTADATAASEHQKDLAAVDSLAWAHPKRIYATLKMVFLYGMTRDVIHHQSKGLEKVHQHAPVFDNKVEHLWTTAQVCSAMVYTPLPVTHYEPPNLTSSRSCPLRMAPTTCPTPSVPSPPST